MMPSFPFVTAIAPDSLAFRHNGGRVLAVPQPCHRIILVTPSLAYLPAYVVALNRGWSPSTHEDVRVEHLTRIRRDSQAFVDSLDDEEAKGDPVRQPDGTLTRRLPGFYRWLWDGDFAGVINFRWQPGTPELPPFCLGHIGYGVVPWKRGRGYAKAALALILPEARARGLPYVEIVTDIDNAASQRVVLANGGTLVERFRKVQAYGGGEALRFHITV
jgi:predicted acetyltransferase